ncbi:hypothetical protein ABZU45_38255 [Streptomyces avermitilis]|uniref:hypothetical protein n=1 Tax=Streptomyces avermitilis TaxID=33903 RepID=UPI0033BD789B
MEQPSGRTQPRPASRRRRGHRARHVQDGRFGCYWERAKDAGGEFGSIIANNNLEGPGRVTLNSGEYFKTNRCQEWKKVG